MAPITATHRRRYLLTALLIALVGLAVFWRWRQAPSEGPATPGGSASPHSVHAPSARGVGGRGAVRGADYLVRSAVVMATRIDVALPAAQAEAADVVFELFRRVDARMSEWKATSPLSAVNRAAGGRPVSVPADLYALIRRSLDFGRLTEGAFDITWAALWGLWDFRSESPRVPDLAEVQRRAALVDYRQVELDDEAGTVRLTRPGMKIGLGGIAKGHALDQAARELRKLGLSSFMISSGGQVLVSGKRGTRPWRVGIRHPRGARDETFAVLELTDTSTSTSGDYERFFELNGLRYHHILDPRSGMPARGLQSATVICEDATLADALSTALMVLGRQKALALVQRHAGVEAVLVDDRGQLHTSRGAQRLLRR